MTYDEFPFEAKSILGDYFEPTKEIIQQALDTSFCTIRFYIEDDDKNIEYYINPHGALTSGELPDRLALKYRIEQEELYEVDIVENKEMAISIEKLNVITDLKKIKIWGPCSTPESTKKFLPYQKTFYDQLSRLNLDQLTTLYLENLYFEQIPDLDGLKQLSNLHMGNLDMERLPNHLYQHSLRELQIDLFYNRDDPFTFEFPRSIEHWREMEKIVIRGSKMDHNKHSAYLPEGLAELDHLKEFQLEKFSISNPQILESLELTTMRLMNCELDQSHLPNIASNKLKHLALQSMKNRGLPKWILECPNLETLELNDLVVEEIPEFIQQISPLEKFSVPMEFIIDYPILDLLSLESKHQVFEIKSTREYKEYCVNRLIPKIDKIKAIHRIYPHSILIEQLIDFIQKNTSNV